MQRFRLIAPLLLAPLALVLALGCGGGTPSKKATTQAEGPGPEEEPAKTPVKSKGWATLKGKVTYVGDPPTYAEIPAMKTHKDHEMCEAGDLWEKAEQNWLVGKDNGLANVAIWISPTNPQTQYFEVKDEDKHRKDIVVMDQPHCAFIPHVVHLYPSYYDKDGKTLKPSGQKFEVKNSADKTHNTAYSGNDIHNPGKGPSYTILSMGMKDITLKPQATSPVQFKCDVHQWMRAYAWVFPHPYSAVTDKDGNYEIKGVPAGAEVSVVAWHEGSKGFPGVFVLPEMNGSLDGEKMTFKDGEVKEVNFKVKKN